VPDSPSANRRRVPGTLSAQPGSVRHGKGGEGWGAPGRADGQAAVRPARPAPTFPLSRQGRVLPSTPPPSPGRAPPRPPVPPRVGAAWSECRRSPLGSGVGAACGGGETGVLRETRECVLGGGGVRPPHPALSLSRSPLSSQPSLAMRPPPTLVQARQGAPPTSKPAFKISMPAPAPVWARRQADATGTRAVAGPRPCASRHSQAPAATPTLTHRSVAMPEVCGARVFPVWARPSSLTRSRVG